MLIRRASLAFVPLFLVTVVACDSKDDEGGDGCTAYVNALVDYSTRCGNGSDGIQESKARLQQVCAKALAAPGQSGFAESLGACAGQLASASCKDLSALDDCASPKGTLADGTACAEDYQCASGYCQTGEEPSSSGPDCGTCAPRVAAGGACTTSSACADGLDCESSSGGGSSSRTCTAPARGAAGAECQPFSSKDCAKGLVCNTGDGAGKYTCQAPAKAGAKCATDAACEGDLVCDDKTDTCVAPAAEGASCAEADCRTSLVCDPASKTCKKPTYVAVGAACDHTVTFCTTGFCKGYKSDFDVETGATTTTPGTCAAYLADGAACVDDPQDGTDRDRCAPFAECVAGKCTLGDPAVCK